MSTRKTTPKRATKKGATQKNVSQSTIDSPEPANKEHLPGTSSVINPNASSETADKKFEHPIPPPTEKMNGTQRHEVAASRGDELAFHQTPQGGSMNLDNLKG